MEGARIYISQHPRILVFNYLAIDLESWARSPRGALATLTSAERKTVDDGAIVVQTRTCLDVLRRLDLHVTFFITSEIFDWYPRLVEEVAREGHEIAFHTHCHEILGSSWDLERALRDAAGFIKAWNPKGFRAPGLWMLRETYAVLAQAGFLYSSSVYGPTEEPLVINGVVEIPVSTHRFRRAVQAIPQPMTLGLWLREIPFGSGYFLALFGWRAVHALMKLRESYSLPSNLFVHNWQLAACGRAQRIHLYRESLHNPLFLPYTRIVRKEFVQVLSRHRFTPLSVHPMIGAAPLTHAPGGACGGHDVVRLPCSVDTVR